MYDENQEQDLEESFVLGVIYDYNQEYRGSKGSGIDVIKKLVEYKILEIKNTKYRFKHSYICYYFTGSFIKNQLPPNQKSEIIKTIFSDLSKEINFNIALFLAYDMNIEFEVLPQIQKISKEILSKYENFEYNQQSNLIKEIQYDVDRKVDEILDIPKNIDIPKIQEKKALLQDVIEVTEEDGLEDFNEDKNIDEALEEIFIEVNKISKIIEFSGDILKNYSSSIRRLPRIEIIKLMYKSSLKLIGAFYYLVKEMLDPIIEMLDERVKESKEEIALKSELKKEVNEFLNRFWSAFLGLTVTNWGYYLQSGRIINEILDIRSNLGCTFFKLTSIDYLIRTQNGRLPIKEIQECIQGQNKLDTFSLNILKQNVALFLKNYQYNEKDKQKICSLLHFNIKDVFIEEQKSNSLNYKN